MGVNVDRIISFTFFIGAALAGAAGFIYALDNGSTIFTIGFNLGLIAFTAAVLGGIGNILGAMLGGLLIGVIESLATLIPNWVLPHGGDAWSRAIIFAVLILILIFRPSGLLGQQTPDKVPKRRYAFVNVFSQCGCVSTCTRYALIAGQIVGCFARSNYCLYVCLEWRSHYQ